MRRASVRAMIAGLLSTLLAATAGTSGWRPVLAADATSFQFPLPSWNLVGFNFGSTWTFGTCPAGVYKQHTGFDAQASVGQAVASAANGSVYGNIFDPTWGYAMLLQHNVPGEGTVTTQYWHVNPTAGTGATVNKGDQIATVYDLGSNTHLHFAVFRGGVQNFTWRGALPTTACGGDPAFPNSFANPVDYVNAHASSQPTPRPTVVIYNNQIGIYTRGGDGQIWNDVYTPGSGWSGFSALAGGSNFVGDPTAIVYGNQIGVYARGGDGQIWSDVYTPGSGWSGFSALAGGSNAAGDPAAIVYGNQIAVYARGGDGQIWSDVYTPGSGWSGFSALAGGSNFVGGPTAIVYGNQIGVYVAGVDGTYNDVYTPSSGWTGFARL